MLLLYERFSGNSTSYANSIILVSLRSFPYTTIYDFALTLNVVVHSLLVSVKSLLALAFIE